MTIPARMIASKWLVLVSFAVGILYAAKPAGAFDTATVTASKAADARPISNIPLGPGDVFPATAGTFSASNFPLLSYIAFAWKLTDSQVQALRVQARLASWGWVASDRFDIQARMAPGADKDRVRLMMQSLLAERFKLAARLEPRDYDMFGLMPVMPGRTGARAARALNAGHGAIHVRQASDGSGRVDLEARNVTMEVFANRLAALGPLDRPVEDRTGLKGSFDFELAWTRPGEVSVDSFFDGLMETFGVKTPAPPFADALRNQLGLRLAPQRTRSAFLVIDRLERLSSNGARPAARAPIGE